MGYIYKITNKINNKIYIGKTKGSIENRLNGHFRASKNNKFNRYFYNAINKYGEENFSIQIIEECDNSLLNNREKYWIDKLNSYDKNIGYNSTLGGDGGDTYTYQTEERKIEISNKKSKSLKGKSLGTKRSEEQRRKISEGHLGQKAWNKGLSKETDERVRKISESLAITNSYKKENGIIISTGKAKTEEAEKLRRKKIKEGMKGKKNGLGNKSTKGQKWINKEGKRTLVPNDEIEYYLSLGWKLGMK